MENNNEKYKLKVGCFISCIIGVLLALALSQFVGLVRVSGKSMEPNYNHGQILATVKVNAENRYKKGDVIAIKPSEHCDMFLIKRIIAVEGDTLTIKNNTVFLNGKKLEEIYIKEDMTDNFLLENKKIAKNEIFVMGDNRNNSSDSRVYGSFNNTDIYGIILNY